MCFQGAQAHGRFRQGGELPCEYGSVMKLPNCDLEFASSKSGSCIPEVTILKWPSKHQAKVKTSPRKPDRVFVQLFATLFA